MSLPTFLLPSANKSSNFKSVFEIITASAVGIKEVNLQNVLVLYVNAKIKLKVQISATLNFSKCIVSNLVLKTLCAGSMICDCVRTLP